MTVSQRFSLFALLNSKAGALEVAAFKTSEVII